ncbi:MAG: formyl transferase, partial [Deltaproteobacteria bacterium]|nr:formyl transferase [Deltaproteobacteria bacterium]
MHILFLGPACPPIEACFSEKGHTFTRTEETLSLAWVREQGFDFGLSYRYKKIIRQDVIAYFAGKLLNMHISFLPWNRGADPNLWSYIEDSPKGVTIHRVDTGIDTGDILLQQEVDIDLATDTLRTSYDKLSRAVENLLINNAGALLTNALPAAPQIGAGSFHYAKDKLPFSHLMDSLGFDTQLSEIIYKLRGGGGGG